MRTITTSNRSNSLAERICARRPLFLKGSNTPDAEIDSLVDAEEADLLALASLPASLGAKARALNATLFVTEGAEPSAGEWALLRAVLAEATAAG